MSKSHVAILLDKSGSMNGLREATVSTYNEQVQQLKINAQEGEDIAVSLLTFNGGVYEHLWCVPADQLELASVEGYNPEGSTNIWDAMGYTVKRWSLDTDAENPDNIYLMIIISDGRHEHHGQVNWTAERLRDHIAELQSTKRWTFSFLGCSQHIVDDFARQTGIPRDNMGIWSNRSATAAVATAGNAAEAIGNYFSTGKQCANFYSPDAGVVADFTGGEAQEAQNVNVLHARGVLRSMGLSPMADRAIGLSPMTYGSSSVGAGAEGLAAFAEPPVEPKYVLGSANVFGSSRKV